LILVIYEIIVSNGNFKAVKNGVGEADLNGLNLQITGIQIPEEKNDTLFFDSIDISSNAFKASLIEKKVTMQTGNISYRSGDLLVSKVTLQQKTLTGENSLNIQALSVAGFNKDQFLNHNEIHFDTLLLSGPVIEGNLVVGNSSDGNSNKAFESVISPFNFRLNALLLEDGRISSSVVVNDRAIKAISGEKIAMEKSEDIIR